MLLHEGYRLTERISDTTSLQVLFLDTITKESIEKKLERSGRYTSMEQAAKANPLMITSGMPIEELQKRIAWSKGDK